MARLDSPTGLTFCTECRAKRSDAASLKKHCMDMHDGRMPLMVCEPEDYPAAVALLRKAKIKITALDVE